MAKPSLLPAVIGPTENALRALLGTALTGNPIAGNSDVTTVARRWVAMNIAGSSSSRSTTEDTIAETLAECPDNIQVLLAGLRDDGLLALDASLTAAGQQTLAAARAAVTHATAGLTEGLADEDIAVATRVLTHIRERARRVA